MKELVIAWSTPAFFVLIVVELVVGLLRGRNTYRANDATTSLALGVLSEITAVFTVAFRFGIYTWFFHHFAIAHWPEDTWWTWVLALVFYDLCYYWFHREGHLVATMWASHVVHHSSEDYNLSTALRQSSTSFLFAWMFYVPMAIAGVPPEMFVVVSLIDLLYQFWIHTQQIGSLGWFDWVFASPSNHRVHHAVNDRYVDKNYGGMLMVWDHLFGTFEPEDAAEPPVYGTRAPLRSFDPIWANLEVFAALARESTAHRRFLDKLLVWVMPPGWTPPRGSSEPSKPPFILASVRLYDPEISRTMLAVALGQFGLVLAAAVHFLTAFKHMGSTGAPAAMAWMTAVLVCIGGLLQGRRFFLVPSAILWAAALAIALTTGTWFGFAWA